MILLASVQDAEISGMLQQSTQRSIQVRLSNFKNELLHAAAAGRHHAWTGYTVREAKQMACAYFWDLATCAATSTRRQLYPADILTSREILNFIAEKLVYAPLFQLVTRWSFHSCQLCVLIQAFY